MKIESLSKIISKPLDRRIVTTLSKGGRSFDYIEGFAIYPLLREAFGDDFSIKYSEPRVTKYGSVQSKNGEYTPPEVVEVKCTLTVHMDGHDIVREGFGAATMNPGKGGEENVLKAAQTDSLKKTCQSFGIGLELSAQKEPKTIEWYQENIFGVWTQAAAARCKTLLESAKNYMQKKGVTQGLDALGHYAFGKPTRVTPNNIEDVLTKLAEKEKSSDGEKVA